MQLPISFVLLFALLTIAMALPTGKMAPVNRHGALRFAEKSTLSEATCVKNRQPCVKKIVGSVCCPDLGRNTVPGNTQSEDDYNKAKKKYKDTDGVFKCRPMQYDKSTCSQVKSWWCISSGEDPHADGKVGPHCGHDD